MTDERCQRALEWAELVDHWAGDLAPEVQDALDEHMLGCASCNALSARVAAITEALRAALPPVITAERLAALRARGLRVLENPMHPGERREVFFPRDVDLLIHRLSGHSLADATRVEFTLVDEDTGDVMAHVEHAPFDVASGSVLVACQKHYAVMPPNTVARTRVFTASGGSSEQTFTILHRYASAEDG